MSNLITFVRIVLVHLGTNKPAYPKSKVCLFGVAVDWPRRRDGWSGSWPGVRSSRAAWKRAGGRCASGWVSSSWTAVKVKILPRQNQKCWKSFLKFLFLLTSFFYVVGSRVLMLAGKHYNSLMLRDRTIYCIYFWGGIIVFIWSSSSHALPPVANFFRMRKWWRCWIQSK